HSHIPHLAPPLFPSTTLSRSWQEILCHPPLGATTLRHTISHHLACFKGLRHTRHCRHTKTEYPRLCFLRFPSTFCLPPFSALSRSEEHTSELQSLAYLVCRLL